MRTERHRAPNAARTAARPRRARVRLPARVPLAARLAMLGAALLMLVPPAGAQPYFAESDTLRRDTALELIFSDLQEDARTVNGSPLTVNTVDSSLLRLEGRYRRGILSAGAMTETRQTHEIFQGTTDAFDLRDERRQSAGYAALALEGLLADDDALYLVLSTSRRHERFNYDAYQRLLDYQVGLQTGIVYRLAFVVAGYVRGDETLDLRLSDVAFEQERYDYHYTAWLAGIVLGSPEDVGLALVYQRKDTPAVAGVSVNLEEGHEQLQRISLALGALRLDYVQTRVREAFTGTSASIRESAEREFALGFQVTDTLRMGVSQKRVDDLQGFTISGAPATGDSERTENQFRVALRF